MPAQLCDRLGMINLFLTVQYMKMNFYKAPLKLDLF